MTLTIGRVSVAAPTGIAHSGDRLSLTFDILPATLAEAKVRRQQVLGLADNPDEPVVPVTWSDDSDYDGYYHVASASVSPTITYLTGRLLRCSVELERIGGGYAKPMIEVAVAAAVRSNQQSVTTLNPPAASGWLVTGFPVGNGEAGNTASLFTLAGYGSPLGTATGNLQTATIASLTNATSDVLWYYSQPADFYDGAAMIEVSRDNGSTWYPVVGRQIPSGVTLYWRISNGLVRVSPSFDDVNVRGELLVEVWSGSAWESMPTMRRRFDSSGSTIGHFGFLDPTSNATYQYTDPVILANGADQVALQIPQANGRTETYTLRRGVPFVDLTLIGPAAEYRGVSATAASWTLLEADDIAASGTADIGGSGATDGNGNSLIVTSSGAAGPTVSISSTTLVIYPASSGSAARYAIGVTSDPAGSTTASLATAAVATSMFTAVATRQQVTSR